MTVSQLARVRSAHLRPGATSAAGTSPVARSPGSSPASPSGARACRSSSRAIPRRMLWSARTTSPSRPIRTPAAYSSAPRRISSASAPASATIRRPSTAGGLGETRLVDEERRLLLRPGDDPLGLLPGPLEDALALGVDAAGRGHLLRDGVAELVDELEGGRLVDDDVVRQGQLPAVREHRLEALDEEHDVDGSALLADGRRAARPVPAIIDAAPARSRPSATPGSSPGTRSSTRGRIRRLMRQRPGRASRPA